MSITQYIITKSALKRLSVLLGLSLIGLAYLYGACVWMPGRSFSGSLPAATPAQLALAEELQADVTVLADATGGVGRAGNRSTFYPKRFAAAASWIRSELEAMGHTVNEIPVNRSPVPNFEVIIPGTSLANEILVVGAHYDAFQGTPGADDNASGVAACLYYARVLKDAKLPRTVRVLFFVNEEPPTFWTKDMGSWVYAKQCRAQNDNIVAMISVESIGYYSTKPNSQVYPTPLNWLYPSTGDFISFVSNYSSRKLNKRAIRIFREQVQFPSEGGSPPGVLPGVGWSDHWSFWQEGYPAIMMTNTATFRNPNYHTPTDTPSTLDYDRFARVTLGLESVIRTLATEP